MLGPAAPSLRSPPFDVRGETLKDWRKAPPGLGGAPRTVPSIGGKGAWTGQVRVVGRASRRIATLTLVEQTLERKPSRRGRPGVSGLRDPLPLRLNEGRVGAGQGERPSDEGSEVTAARPGVNTRRHDVSAAARGPEARPFTPSHSLSRPRSLRGSRVGRGRGAGALSPPRLSRDGRDPTRSVPNGEEVSSGPNSRLAVLAPGPFPSHPLLRRSLLSAR